LFTHVERPCNSYDFSDCCDRICNKPLWVKGLQGLASQGVNCFAILCFAQWDALTILSELFHDFRLARWLVPKFAEKRVFKAYTFCLYVLLIRFAYTVGLALLKTVGLFMFDAEP
jgi:hypothetical protein